MTYREIYENAFTDFEFGNITLEEFEERVKPLNQESTGVIEELDKIREEILSEYPYAESDKARLIGYGIHIALETIDKRIAELKGSD